MTVAHDEAAVDRYVEVIRLSWRAELGELIRRSSCDCSRMNCGRYQGPRPPLPVEPLDFQPQKVCVPGQAPVVAPARRFT